jgi:hypothetical protein
MPKCDFTVYVKGGVPQYLTVNADKKQTQYKFSDTDEEQEYYTEFKYDGGMLGVWYESGKVQVQYCRSGRWEDGYEPKKSMTIKQIE